MPTPYLSRLKLEKELEKKAQILREKKERCDALMEKIEKHFGLVEGAKDIDDLKNEFKKGKEYYELKDMDAAIEVFEELDKKLINVVKSVYEDRKREIEKILSSVPEEEAIKVRANLKEADEKIEEDPERSFEILKEIEENIVFLIEESVNHLERELKDVFSVLPGMEWVSAEVDALGDKKDAETLLKLKEIENKAIEEIRNKIDEIVSKTKKIIEIAASAHFNLPVDRDAEGKIKELMDSGNYSGALRAAEEYLKSAKKSFEFFYRKLYDISRRIVEEGKAMGIDISEPLKYLDESKEKYESDDFEGAVALIKKATEEAEKKKFQAVLEVIKQARELFIEAKNQGIDINPFLKRIDNARNFLKIGKHKKAYDVVLETIDMVKRKKDLYTQLKEEIKRIKTELKDLEKENIILEGVDESVRKIEETLESNAEEAEKLLNKLRDVIKSSLKDIAQALYTELSKMVEIAEQEKMAVEDLKLAMEDAKVQMADENYKDAILSLRKIEEDIYTRIEDYLKELEKRTSKYKDERIKETLKSAFARVENGDLGGTFDEIKKIKELIFEIEGNEYKKKIAKMKEKAEFLRSAGGNVTEVLSYVERAEVALKKKDVVKAEDYINRSEEALKALENLVAKDTFDSAKAIAAAAKRLGVDIGKQGIMTLLKRAKDSIEKGDFESAIRYSVDAREKARMLRDEAERAYSQLVNAAKRVAKLKEMGANVKSVAKLLVDAKNNFEANNFAEAERLSVECINRADKLENRARIENVRRELDMIGKVMRDLGLGNEFKRSTLDFYSKYEDMQYTNLAEYGEKILSELREHVETILTDYIGKIETDIYDAKGKGYDLKINMDDLENAKDLFIKRKYLDALNILKKLESQIASVYEKNEKMAEARSKIKKYMDMAISLGIDVSQYKKDLDALSSYSDMRKVEAETNRIIRDIEAALYKKVRSLIVSVEKELDSRRRRGEDVTTPESILNKAKAYLKEKKYVDALNKAMAAVGEIEKYDIQKNTAYGILKRLETKIKSMSKILPNDIIKEYEYSKKLFLKGLYEQSIQRSMKVSDKISEIERVINYIKEKNKEIREMVMKAHRLGMDVRDVLKIFNQAKEEFKNMNYQNSLRLVDQCYTEAKMLMIEAVNRYKSVYSKMITLIKRTGLDDYFKDRMEEMDKLFEKGDYESIKVKISEMQKDLDRKLQEVCDSRITELQKTKRLLRNMRISAPIDLDSTEMQLKELKLKDPSHCLEEMYSVENRLESVMPQLIKNKVDSLKSEFDKYEGYGINMDQYHTKLYEILSLVEERDYGEIFKMLEEVESSFKRYLDEYVKTLEFKINKRVGEYSKELAEDYVNRMERLRKVGSYIDAFKVYEDANNYIARYKVFKEEFGKRVEEVKDQLRLALSLGLKVGYLISQLKEIEEKAPLNMEKARVDLNNLRSKVSALLDTLEPKIEVSLEIGEEKDGVHIGKLTVKNVGNVDAQNVNLSVRGAYVSDEVVEILKIEKGAEGEVELSLRKGHGVFTRVMGKYYRFDGKEYDLMVELKAEEKKESKGYHVEKATEKVKCALCRGTILPSMNLDVVVCDNCGAVYHVPCAKRIKKCKVCGQEFKFD